MTDTFTDTTAAPGLHTYALDARNASGASAQGTPETITVPGGGGGGTLDTLVILLMENKALSAITASTAPYMASLLPKGAQAMAYTPISVPSSLPNYLAMTCGSELAQKADCDSCIFNSKNVVDLIEAAGLTWGAYMQSLGNTDPLCPFPSVCGPKAGQNPYDNHHDPFPHFLNVHSSPARMAKVVDLSKMPLGNLPNYSFISPDVLHDMHSASVSAGDTYLKGLVPQILGSADFAPGKRAALFITFDNGPAVSDPLYAVLLGPAAKVGFKSTVKYNHYSMLKSAETWLGLGSLGTGDKTASAMSDLLA